MSFMQPEITYDLFLVIETRDGDTVLPADAGLSADFIGSVIRPNLAHGIATYGEENPDEAFEDLSDALQPYLETHAPIQSIHAKHAWGARLSAPGYMDCTEWSLYDTAEEAREALAEETADDEGEE